MTREQKQTLQFALLGLIVICLRYPLLALGTKTFFDIDWAIFCEPVAQYNKANLLAGHIPAWCPLIHNGTPYLAQWNTMVCYPGILIYLLLPTDWGLNLFQLLHVAWGGLGMYLLARKLNCGHHVGACIIGLSYELNGVCLSLMDWPQNLSNYSWVPWVILLQLKAIREGGRWLGWAALAIGLHLLTGLPEFNLITWTFSLAVGWAERGPEVRLPRAFLRWAGSLALGLGVAAIQLLPSAVLIATNSDASRGGANAEWALDGSGLVNFILPAYDVVSGVYADRPYVQFWMTVHYVNLGLTALGLVVAWKHRHDRLVVALVLAGVAWTLLAGGWRDPLMGPIIKHLPVISRMRYPIKFVLGTVLMLQLLACLYWRQENRKVLRSSLVLALALPPAALALGWFFKTLAQMPNPPLNLGRLAAHTTCGIALLALIYPWRGKEKTWPRVAAAAAILLLNTWVASRDPNPKVSVRSYSGNPIREYCRAHNLPVPEPEQGRLHLAAGGRKPNPTAEEDVRTRRLLGQGNATLMEDIANVDGFTSLGPRWQEIWAGEINRAGAENSTGQLTRMLEFCGARLTAQVGGDLWHPRTNAMPLVTIGQQAVLQTTPTNIFAQFASEGLDPRTTVFVGSETHAQADPAARATLAHCEPEKWSIDAQASVPTILVISQTWYPGWHATVNGQPARIMKANVAFQAVEVPAGRSRVELRYREPFLTTGVTVTLLSLLVSLGLCCFPVLPSWPKSDLGCPKKG